MAWQRFEAVRPNGVPVVVDAREIPVVELASVRFALLRLA
jgi:hypothetical protein